MGDEDLSSLKRRFWGTPDDISLALGYSRALERAGNKDDALMVLLDAYYRSNKGDPRLEELNRRMDDIHPSAYLLREARTWDY